MFFHVKNQDKVDFTKNLAVMLKSGMTIDEALTSLAEQVRSKRFRRIIERVRGHIEHGTRLSESFGKEEKFFGTIFVSLIKSAESSGTLEENLNFLAEWLERNQDLRSEMKAATIYPKFVLTATFFVGGALAVYILPKLLPLFTSLRVELPFATKLLLGFSSFLEHYWFIVLVGIGIGIGVFMFLKTLPPVKKILHTLLLKIPFIGDLFIAYQLALICQLFSTLFRSGILMNESLEVVESASTNLVYKNSLKHIRRKVDRGETLSHAMAEYPHLYPKNMISIVSTGEKSGALPESFEYLSEFYGKEVKHRTKKLPTILEPALLIFIAFVVGFIALSIIMPIYQLTSGLGG